MDIRSEQATKPNAYYATPPRHDLIDMVPSSALTLLDVGCAEGAFGASLLQERVGLEVWGIEPVRRAAETATTRLTRVLNMPIEQAIDALPDAHFDCITFNDVLEHLTDPWQVLRAIRPKIKKQGHLLTSIPNIRHLDVMKDLVFNADFQYAEQGVLDSTHLRFFTRKSMQRMLSECGFDVQRIEGLRWTRFPFALAIADRLLRRRLDDLHYLQFAILSKVGDNH